MITVSNVFAGVPPLFSDLAKALSGEIDCSHQAIELHSVDGCSYAVRPQAVVYPRSTTDIKHVIAFAREYHMPITVRGGGTASTGGSLGEGIVINMTRYFTRIRQVNLMEHTVTVDAGVTLRELQEKLALWHMEIPVLHGDFGDATVGGFVATKSATASSFYAGTVREWIEGLNVIVDTGEEHHLKDGITPSGRLLGIYQSVFPFLSEHGPILRAAKRDENDDATGYSVWSASIGPRQLMDQMTGSEGTLGIITSVTFRVVPRKRNELTYLIPLEENHLEKTIGAAAHHRAEALFMFDMTYKNLLDKLRPGMLPQGVEEAPFYLLLALRDNDERAIESRAASLLHALPSSFTAKKIEQALVHRLASHENVHRLLYDYSQKNHIPATIGEGIIVPRQSLQDCLHDLDEAVGKTGLVYILSGFVGSGHISVTTLMDPRSPSHEKDLLSYNESICAIIEKYHGGLSAVGGDGLERSAYLDFVFSESALKVFDLLRKAWDPLGIFNPGKKTAVSTEYLRRHARNA